MSSTLKNKVIIIAPFWGKDGHVGNYRIDRFIRWLKEENCLILLISAGNKNEIIEKGWGIEVISKDFIGVITGWLRKFSEKINVNLFLYAWFIFVMKFIPIDEFYFWSAKILKIKKLDELLKGAHLIISSSPPNSVHIAAYKLSKKYSIPMLTDLRDGWLDEPFQSKLNKQKILRKLEKKWEYNILIYTSLIFVTSINWKNLLISRLPVLKDKVVVLTNSYPDIEFSNFPEERYLSGRISLLYSGRIAASDLSRSINDLFEPFFNYLKINRFYIDILLISELRREEVKKFQVWKKKFRVFDVQLTHKSYMNRDELFNEMVKCNGVFLLSSKMGTIPLKLFDYIKSRRPILAITPHGSAIWQLENVLPQLFLFDYTMSNKDYSSIEKFFEACKTGNYACKIPEEFSEEYLSKTFIGEVKSLF